MNVKKAQTVVTEIFTYENGDVVFLLRTVNGQPVSVCQTPSQVLEMFTRLSSSEEPSEGK